MGAVVCAVACAWASPAVAAVWAAPVPGCSIITAYGSTYRGCIHRGVDLAAESGQAVSSPASGTIVFAGSVPADGGGTCNAVTVELASGERVSLLPLAELWVNEGMRVVASEQLGSLAASGDDSSARSHLHLSLRRDGAYLDPTALLPGALPGSEATSEWEAEASPVVDVEPVVAMPEVGAAIVPAVSAAAVGAPATSGAAATTTSASVTEAPTLAISEDGGTQQSTAAAGAEAGDVLLAAAAIGSEPRVSPQVIEAAEIPRVSALAPPRITAGSVPGVLASLSAGALAVSTTRSLPALLGGVCIAALSAVALRRRLSAVEF